MNGEFDGEKQRRALTAAEQALRALGNGDAAKARSRAARAAELDQIGTYASFVDSLAPLADQIEAGEAISDAGWDHLANSLGMGPLSGLIDELRG